MIDPVAEATRLVDSLGAEQLVKAAAYTRGNEVLLVVGLGVTLLVAWLIVRSRVLDHVAGKTVGWKPFLATFVVCFTYFVVDAVFTLPWTVWTDWSRERSYGLSDQPLGDFLSQMALSTGIEAVLGSLFLVGVYALIRRAGKLWWAWGGAFAGVVAVIMLLAGPPMIEPLFNTFTPVPAGPVRASLEQIANDVGIPHDRIFLYDGSRQSDRFTANVSGIGPAARIAISDVAMKSASLDEVRAVTGHEAGHYQLGHIWRQVILLPVLAVLVLFAIDRLFPRVAAAMGSRATLGDPVGLPVFMVLAAIAGFLANPVLNAFSRAAETEADAYSMEHVGLPDAMATALLKTAEYRYPRPHPVEEVLFYTHPSVERRVLRAMEWKAQHQSGQPAAPQ